MRIFVIRRTAMQLLSEFGSQKIKIFGVGVSRLRERGQRYRLLRILDEKVMIGFETRSLL
jgi:hypothetical protein